MLYKIQILANTSVSTVLCEYIETGFIISGILIIAVIITSKLREWFPKIKTKKYRNIMQFCSVGFLSTAGIGKLGWAIQTWDGTSNAENWNIRIFWGLSLIGAFLVFTKLYLDYKEESLLYNSQNETHKSKNT
ncbi:MAG: hypothetical protein NTW55_00020 [Planctomycetota bacterium]|nr:hypothetical protein [Planctomycetota bacterium]